MKARSMISGMLIGLGCAMTFLGFLAVIVPGINNKQLNLVLDSFNVSAKNAAIYVFNSFARFLLQNSWQTVAVGGLALGIGLWLFGFAEKERNDEEEPAPYRPVQSSKPVSYVRPLPESSPIHTTGPVRKANEPLARSVPREEVPSSNPFARPYAPFVPSAVEPVEQEDMHFSNVADAPTFSSYSVHTQTSVAEKEPAFYAMPAVSEAIQENPFQSAEPDEILPSDASTASFESNEPESAPPVRIKSTIGMHRKW